MGNNCTSLQDIANNEYLNRFCGTEWIAPADPFWNRLLSIGMIVNDALFQDQAIQAFLSKLCTNLSSGNLPSLVQAIVSRAEQLKHDGQSENMIPCWQLANALAIMRIIVRYCAEVLPNDKVVELFNPLSLAQRRAAEAPVVSTSERTGRSRQRPVTIYGDVRGATFANEAQLLSTVIQLLIDVPVNSLTYYVHLECLQLLLAGLATQAYRSKPVRAGSSIFYYQLLHGPCAAHANPLLRTLLNNLCARMQLPPRTLLQIVTEYGLLPDAGEESRKALRKVHLRKDELRVQPAPECDVQPAPASNTQSEGSMLYNATAYVASTLLYVVTLGRWNTADTTEQPLTVNTPTPVSVSAPVVFDTLTNASPLATYSVLLLLVLTNHCVYSLRSRAMTQRKGVTVPQRNIYRETLLVFGNSSDPPADHNVFCVDFERVYRALAATCIEEHCTLALYLLMHRNIALRAFALEKDEVATLIVPVLRVLYDPAERSAQHVNMALALLLIVSENDDFAKSIHQTKLIGITWFKERILNEITVGSLFILVVIRVMQFNLSRTKDRSVQSNCMAMLTNMSNEFRDLHPYVPQRILAFVNQLLKRRDKLTGLLNAHALLSASETSQRETKPSRVEQALKRLTLSELASGKLPAGANSTEQKVAANPSLGSRRGSNSSIATITSVSTYTGQSSTGIPLTHNDVITYESEIELLEELIRKWIDILNACLVYGLQANVNLLYALLYERELVAQLKRRAQFATAMQNIDLVLLFLTKRIETVQTEQCVNELSVEMVIDTISDSIRFFRRDRLKKTPLLAFKYVEEDDPEEFFVPYIWSLIYRFRSEGFSADRIKLFQVPSIASDTVATSSTPQTNAPLPPSSNPADDSSMKQTTNESIPQSVAQTGVVSSQSNSTVVV